MIDISGLNKAQILAALYNGARPLGYGWLHYTPEDMTLEEAQAILDGHDPVGSNGQRPYFDYLKGRAIKVNLSGDAFDPYLYNRDNGQDAAESIIAVLRQEQTGCN